MLTRELIARLPKAELHVHFDGSLRPETIIDMARAEGVALPHDDPGRLRQHMLVDDARDLEEYLDRFQVTIALLQTPEALERVAYEIVEDAARDNLLYIEVRYCPTLSTASTLETQLADGVPCARTRRKGPECGEKKHRSTAQCQISAR